MSWLSNVFGGNKKRDTSYQGATPFTSLRQAEGGQEYIDALRARLAGRGVGFGDDYASRSSSPIIANMRNRFDSYDIPALKSELSATGRRRGSGGFDQMRRAFADQGYQEGDVYARLYQGNEAQKRNEINAALEDLGVFNQGDYNARNVAANFGYQQNRDLVGDATVQRKEGADATRLLIGTATGLMSGIPGSSGITSGGNLQGFNSKFQSPTGAGYYRPSVPPEGYNYRNMASANNRYAKTGQYGRVR